MDCFDSGMRVAIMWRRVSSQEHMKQWYYVESGEQRGPLATAEISRLLEHQQLAPDTPVWTEGMEDWTEIRRIPELEVSPYTPPAVESVAGPSWDGYEATGSQIRPWVRYWARTFDFLLFGMFAGIVLELVYPKALDLPGTALGIVLMPAFIFVEAAMFAVAGTTPFKALLNVRVRNHEGRKLSYAEALRRSFSVWLRGLGMGIPVVTLVTNITAYKRLSDSGVTSWDSDGGFTVSHRKIGVWRLLVLLACFGGFIALLVIGEETGGGF